MHEPHQVIVTLGTVLIIDRLFLTMGSGTLMTAQAIHSIIGPAEILFAMGDHLERREPRKIVFPSALRRVTGCTGFPKSLLVNG
jgi:hypothetical protein